MRILVFVGALAASLALASRVGFAFSNEPNGFGGAKFGMSPDAVKQVFPTLQSKGAEDFLAFYQLENQSVLGLKACRVDLRFVDQELYEIQFHCEPKERVLATLKKEFGEPTEEKPGEVFWFSRTRAVSLNPRSTAFGFVDRERNDLVQHKLMQYMLRQQMQSRTTPGVSATPVPTP